MLSIVETENLTHGEFRDLVTATQGSHSASLQHLGLQLYREWTESEEERVEDGIPGNIAFKGKGRGRRNSEGSAEETDSRDDPGEEDAQGTLGEGISERKGGYLRPCPQRCHLG